MDNNNFVPGFGTISFDADSDCVFGRITCGSKTAVTVKGHRDQNGFKAEGDGVVVTAIRREGGATAPVATVTITVDGQETVADMWRPKTGTAFGLSAPKATRYTTNW